MDQQQDIVAKRITTLAQQLSETISEGARLGLYTQIELIEHGDRSTGGRGPLVACAVWKRAGEETSK